MTTVPGEPGADAVTEAEPAPVPDPTPEVASTAEPGPAPPSTGLASPSPVPPARATHSPTRLSAAWTAVVAAVVILIFLVIFIAQNTQDSEINYLGAHGHAPTAVMLLIAALAGAVIVLVVGLGRIVQLRRRGRREARRPTVAPPDPAGPVQ